MKTDEVDMKTAVFVIVMAGLAGLLAGWGIGHLIAMEIKI